MKSISVLTLGVCLLCGCAATAKSSETTTTAKATVQNTVTSTTSTTKQTTQQTTAVSTTTKKVTKTIDYDAILKGDFSSVAGKWRNQAGYEFTFDEKGIVTEGLKIVGIHEQYGIVYAQIHTGENGFALTFVPKGTVIPKELFYDGTDPSDVTRDRMFGAQAQVSVHKLDPYYRVEE